MSNLLVIAIKINVLMLAAIFVFAFVLGYLVRAGFIQKCKKRIFELEREMYHDNAKILELEKEKADLLRIRNESLNKDQP